MSELARVIWDEIAPVALAMGTLTTADVWAFATLCKLQADLDVSTTPELTIKLASAIRPYYEKFGLEPVGRARISIPKDEPQSKWAGALP